MKSAFAIRFAAVFLLAILAVPAVAFAQPAAENGEEKITMNVQKMDITELLYLIAHRYRVNFVIDTNVRGEKLSLSFEGVPVSTALETIAKAAHCRIVRTTASNGAEVLRIVKMPAKQAYSVAEVAALLGVEPAAILAAIDAGELPAARIGSEHRITRRDLDAWLGEAGSQGLDGNDDGE